LRTRRTRAPARTSSAFPPAAGFEAAHPSWFSPAPWTRHGPQSSTAPWPTSERRRQPHRPDELAVGGSGGIFQLPACHGFLLAGGAALAAQHRTTRPTQDLDFFTSPGRGDVPAVRDELIAAARVRRWQLHVLRNEPTFCRLQINGIDELLVDIALDATPGHPLDASIAGPTLDPSEQTGRNVIAYSTGPRLADSRTCSCGSKPASTSCQPRQLDLAE
jgi:Nucleotidyl transferase AbiEii toxin, Type IV TA system